MIARFRCVPLCSSLRILSEVPQLSALELLAHEPLCASNGSPALSVVNLHPSRFATDAQGANYAQVMMPRSAVACAALPEYSLEADTALTANPDRNYRHAPVWLLWDMLTGVSVRFLLTALCWHSLSRCGQ